MTYTIDHSATIYPLVDEEISRVADVEYGQEGAPQYDAIVLHYNDRSEIRRLQGDAVNTLVKRLHDIVTILPFDGQGRPRLQFRVPDLDTSTESLIDEEITRFIVLNICAAWFQSRARDRVEEFAQRGQVALDKVSAMLHTRKSPER